MSRAPDRVYVVDSDAGPRDEVMQLLTGAGCQSRAFPSGASFLAALGGLPPGCIILDISLSDMSGLELRQQLVAANRRWPLIMLMSQESLPNITPEVAAIFIAFLEKPVRTAEVLAAVMRGQAYLEGAVDIIPDPELVQRLPRLTARERQVLEYFLQQKLDKQTGAILGIEETTVKGYRRTVIKKLGLNSSTQLIVFAIRAGIYDPPRL